MLCGFLLLLLLDNRAHAAPATTETYEYSQTLKTDVFILYWKYTTETVTFEIHVQTEGWVGIGINENSNMIGADLMVGWVKDGTGKLTDLHATANGLPMTDNQQDLNLISAQETDGWTVLKFSRNIAGCEDSADREITPGSLRLIWAYGTTDPSGDHLAAAEKHETQNRGAHSLFLLDKGSESANDGLTHQTLNIAPINFVIPSHSTYYNCILFKLPDSITAEKHHVLKVSPIIQSGNEALVHHMILKICSVPADPEKLQAMENIVGENKPCFVGDLPECRRVAAGWAVGGGALVFPDDTGLPIGDTFAKYMWLETHYDNPSLISGRADGSGMSLTYTSELRTIDIGLWTIGSDVNAKTNFIPPGATAFEHWGFCAGSCLSNSMAAASVNQTTMVGVLLHTHKAGVKIILRHVRSDGTEMEPIADPFYDFDYQDFRLLDSPRTILPGDHFRIECSYDTSDRTQMTLSGLAMTSEMCLAFVVYYPLIDMKFCLSNPIQSESFDFFGIESVQEDTGRSIYDLIVSAPAKYVGDSVGALMDNFNWTTDSRNDFQDALHAAKQNQVCMRENTLFQEEIGVPAINTPHIETRKTCPITTTTSSTTTTTAAMTTTSHGNRQRASYVLAFAATFWGLVFQKMLPL